MARLLSDEARSVSLTVAGLVDESSPGAPSSRSARGRFDSDPGRELFLAAHGQPERMAELLRTEARLEVNWIGKDGGTPLIMAAYDGHEKCMELLLAKGAAVDQANNAGGTPLIIAAENGQENCVELLLAKGAAVDRADSEGYTPLHWAAENGHQTCVELLLANGAKDVR